MKRRKFIALLGGAATAWPLTVHAQQHAMRRIGVLISNKESDPDGQANAGAFRNALMDLGWTEGRNIQIDYRWGAGNPDVARNYVAEVVASSPEVILAQGTPALSALHQVTQNIPVVFVLVTDPVGAGFVESLARPGRNITGFSTFEPEIGGKWLELLNEVLPNLRLVAGILDPFFKGFAAVWRSVENAAQRVGIKTTSIGFHDPTSDIEPDIAALAKGGMAGLIVLPTSTNNLARQKIISLAKHYRLPAVYPFGYYTAKGGLMSYGFDARDLFRQGASYVDRILKGEKPADLPVQAPTKYELVINSKTAKNLGLTVPPQMLVRADAVIE